MSNKKVINHARNLLNFVFPFGGKPHIVCALCRFNLNIYYLITYTHLIVYTNLMVRSESHLNSRMPFSDSFSAHMQRQSQSNSWYVTERFPQININRIQFFFLWRYFSCRTDRVIIKNVQYSTVNSNKFSKALALRKL